MSHEINISPKFQVSEDPILILPSAWACRSSGKAFFLPGSWEIELTTLHICLLLQECSSLSQLRVWEVVSSPPSVCLSVIFQDPAHMPSDPSPSRAGCSPSVLGQDLASTSPRALTHCIDQLPCVSVTFFPPRLWAPQGRDLDLPWTCSAKELTLSACSEPRHITGVIS